MIEEAKFNNLCSHYKDSYEIHRSTIKQRDILFYGLLIILAIFTLQISSPETVVKIVNEYAEKTKGIKIGKNFEFISTLLWLMLLGFSTRYYQIVLEIERQYIYFHELEEEINSNYYSESPAFTREGKAYLSKYPLFSNWVWLLYTLFFPSLIIVSIIARINNEIINMQAVDFNQLIYFTCYLIIGVSSILYIDRLHKSTIIDIKESVSNQIKKLRK